MFICEHCYEECDLTPIEVSLEDEPLQLELYSDCCFDDYLLTDELEVEETRELAEDFEKTGKGYLTSRELTIGRYLGFEI